VDDYQKFLYRLEEGKIRKKSVFKRHATEIDAPWYRGNIEIFNSMRSGVKIFIVHYRRTHRKYSTLGEPPPGTKKVVYEEIAGELYSLFWREIEHQTLHTSYSRKKFRIDNQYLFGFPTFGHALDACANQFDFSGAPISEERENPLLAVDNPQYDK